MGLNPLSIRFHPWYSVSVVAWTAFCHPGMFGALNGLGAGGEETATTSNIVNAVTFGALMVGGFFTGAICNKIGVRWTLVIGTLGYAPYGAAMYTNAAFGNQWFPILGGLTCGTSGVFLWTASGAINLVFPPSHERGRAVATKFTLQNLGAFVGNVISLGLNAKGSRRGRVSDGTYFAFTSIMCLGLPAALTIPRPGQVVRKDGTHVAAHKFLSWKDEFRGLGRMLKNPRFYPMAIFLLYAQWYLSYMFTWNAAYHSVRARALLSTLYYLIGPTLLGPVEGYLLDRTSWSRRNRAKIGGVLTIFFSLLIWIFGLIVQYQYDKRAVTEVIDFVDPAFAKSAILFILYGLLENTTMVILYWTVGSLGLKPGEIASYCGLVNAVGSAGSCVGFALGATSVPLRYQLWAIVITFLVGSPGYLYTIWYKIEEEENIKSVTSEAADGYEKHARAVEIGAESQEKDKSSCETGVIHIKTKDEVV